MKLIRLYYPVLLLCLPMSALSVDLTEFRCQNLMPLQVPRPTSGQVMFGEKPVKYVATTTYSFRPYEEQGSQLMNIEELVSIDLSDLRTQWSAIASSNIPSSSCEERYSPHDYTIRKNGTEALGQVSVTYENWLCAWTWGTCTTTGYRNVFGVRIPYPKVYRCRWESNNKLFQKTVRIDTRFIPKIVDDELNMEVISTMDDRGGIPNALLNVVGVLTLNVGSKFMLDQYRAIISGIKSQLPSLKNAIPGLTIQEEAADLRLAANLRLQKAFFDEQNGHIALIIVSSGATKYNTGCFIQKSLIELASTPNPAVRTK